MAIGLEELLKLEKDKQLDAKYKSVRQSFRLSAAKYVAESSNGSLEKYIRTFVESELSEKNSSKNVQIPQSSSSSSILYSMMTISALMDKVFESVGDSTDSRQSYNLSYNSVVILDELTNYARIVRESSFPNFQERFSYGLSEADEIKTLVISSVFRSIKNIIDRYYFIFRAMSINITAKQVFNKISIFRERLHNFEYFVRDFTKKIEKGDKIQLSTFTRELKASLSNLRKLLEAIDSSNFGKLVNTLQLNAHENGVRNYVKYNEKIELLRPEKLKGTLINLQTIVENYDTALTPIRKSIAGIESMKRVTGSKRSFEATETEKAYWDISQSIMKFRDDMNSINSYLGKIINSKDEDYKFFSHTIQSVILPYSMQARGSVNETFIVEVRNLDTYFFKIVSNLIEQSEADNATIYEVLGLAMNVTKADHARLINNLDRPLNAEDVLSYEVEENKDNRLGV